MVRYYGYYSNVTRGKRKEKGTDDAIPCILEPEGDGKVFRRNWSRLIQKIYEADPLVCPKCQGAMRVIGRIEDPEGNPGHPRTSGLVACESLSPAKAGIKAATENP